MTDLESPKKNNDCYFYYYSTCSKGDSCGFRHEPSALGCETMCSFWKEGKCLNIHCNFRHMELRKNRKVIPCYWESQPGGCLKPHCPFLHQNQRPLASDESKPENALPENCTQAGNFKSTSSVDSLVVNFEEESDSESAPAMSPAKTGIPKVKTLEEIKLEKMAAACAAYYSYPDDNSGNEEPMQLGGDLRQRILQRVQSKEVTSQRPGPTKLSPGELAYILGDSSLSKPDSSDNNYPPYKRRKTTETSDSNNTQDFKIKTLEEIRAERNNDRQEQETINVFPGTIEMRKRHLPIKLSRNKLLQPETMETEESVVSSTSNEEPEFPKKSLKPLRKLNLKKIKALSEETEAIDKPDENMEGSVEDIEESPSKLERSTSNRTVDELLLLDDDGQDISINIKSEDDLLNEIDILLDD